LNGLCARSFTIVGVACRLPPKMMSAAANGYRRQRSLVATRFLGQEWGAAWMIEFDVKCRSCKKLITLRVRDAQVRVFFEEKGALCGECYKVAPQPASNRAAGWRAGGTHGDHVPDEPRRPSRAGQESA